LQGYQTGEILEYQPMTISIPEEANNFFDDSLSTTKNSIV